MKTAIARAAKLASACIITMTLGLSTAHAYVLDQFLGSQDLANSGDGTELSAIESESGVTTLVKLTKIDSNFSIMLNPGTTDQFVIDVGSLAPTYFLIKFGTGNTSFPNTYFFKNVGELNKLVFSNASVNDLFSCGSNPAVCDPQRLSHATLFAGTDGGVPPSSVPEPATLALAGLGLLGFAASRRKARKQ
jgi:hypothetical protein